MLHQCYTEKKYWVDIMKILQVISSFPPSYSYGGALKVAYGISKELAKKNHNVTVYTTDVYDSNSRLQYKTNPEIMDRIKVYHFRNISNTLSRKNLTCAPLMFFSLKNKIHDFDIIHLHEYRSFQAMFVYWCAKKNNIPYIVQAHGSVLPFAGKERLKKLFDFLWGKKILGGASKIIALTKTESDQYVNMDVPENKIVIIPNGIDDVTYYQPHTKTLFKRLYDIPSNFQIILYLGRLHKSKGIDLLIESFAETIKTIQNVKLVIIGPDDGFKENIIHLIDQFQIKKDVLILDFISENEKLSAFFDADVFVTPSFSGFPITFLEACACGTPIITTTKGDNLGWIDNKVGFVVDYDKNQLHDKINEILTNESLKKKFGDEGKKLIIDRFNWAKIVSDIERTYETIKK